MGFAGCGGDDDDADATPINLFDAAPSDAGVPDAFVCNQTECGAACVDISSDPMHCGGCFLACPPAADCDAPDCTCPDNPVPAAPVFFMDQMRTDLSPPPDITGVGPYSGSSGLHLLIVGFDPDSVATGVDLTLDGINTSPFVTVGFEVAIPMDIRSSFLATSGTINLTEACDEGVAGTITDATFVEVDLFGGLTPIQDGCTFTVPTTTFSIADACPSGPDGGVMDAGSP